MGFSEDIAAKIISLSLGTAINTDLFLGSKAMIPSKIENVGPYTNLVDTGGTGGTLAHDERYANPSLQLSVRASSSSIAKAKAEAYHAALCNLHNVTIGSSFYLWIVAVQEVLDMQQDSVGRPKWGFHLNGRRW